MKKSNVIITIIALIIIIALIGTVCYGYYKKYTMEVKNPIATIDVKDFGTIKVELYPEIAPNTVANFVTLANNGYYNGLTFHRIVEGFMIQGGDSKGDGTGSVTLSAIDSKIEKDSDEDKEYTIKGEFIANGYTKNTLKHEEGVISMARADYTSYSSSLADESYNSAGSQFFIMTDKNTSLDGYYTAFGKVIEGLDIVHKIEKVELKDGEDGQKTDTPKDAPVINSITIETYGVNYKKPDTMEPFDYQKWLYSYYGINQN